MKKRCTSLLALLLGLSLSTVTPVTLLAQCAQCSGTMASPCSWGPFASGGGTTCKPAPWPVDGCDISGDCKGGGGELPEGDFLAALRIAPDGFVLSMTPTFVTASMAVFRETGSGYKIASMCYGLLMGVYLGEASLAKAEVQVAALTI